MNEKDRTAKPSRANGGGDGRARIINATSEYLRQKGPIDLPRKQLAIAAGVVPALVAYHFPSDLHLVEAAARPIINGYLERLTALLISRKDRASILRALILLLLEIARDNGHLIDTYVAFAKQQRVDVVKSFLAEAYTHLSAFLAGCEADGFLELRNNAFAQTALWGICKTVAQQRELAAMLEDGDGRDGLAARQADMILDFLFRHRRADSAAPLTQPLPASATSRHLPATG